MATTKDKQIAAAQKLVEKGQFDKAIKAYLLVVAGDDKDVRIWLKIGDLYAKIGKRAEAAETYQKVAEFYSEQGFYLKSVAVYKQILKIDPRLVDVNQRLAELYKQLGLLSDAMQQYEAVAAFHHKEGKTRQALAALKQIVELDPETVANRIKLAELYSKEQMPREAIDEFTRAAEQLKESGRTDDYLKVAERLLFHSPDNRVVSKELARLYIEKGDPRRALPKLQVCFKADSRDTDVLMLLARAFEALEQRAKAVSVLKELARILSENGDRQGRDEVYRKILTLEPHDGDAASALTGPGHGHGHGETRSAAPPPEPAASLGALDRPPTGPGVPNASWPPPKPLREDPSAVRELDEPQPETRLARPEPQPQPQPQPQVQVASAQPQTAVSKLLDSSAVEPARAADGGEEVARILNETDVYIKYKLYAKAIEHVQRVFEHDPQHVEAREKLKALYLSVGKREEAVLELWALAQQAEPGRQRRYLREILELDPGHAQAAAMLGEAPRKAAAGGSDEPLEVDELEELDENDLESADSSGRIDLSEEIGVEEADPAEDDLIPLVVDPISDPGSDPSALEKIEDRFGFDDSDAPQASAPLEPTESEEHAISAGLDLVAAAPRLEPLRSKPRPRHTEERSDDHDVRTRFDDQAARALAQEMMFGGGDSSDPSEEVDERDLPSVENLAAPRDARSQAAKGSSHGGTATVPSASLRALTELPPPERTGESASIAAKTATDGPSESSLEDDLDEADFFVQQSLFEEARAILEALLARHPSHPLVGAKLRDLAALEGAGALPETVSEAQPIASADLSAELPDDLPGASGADAVESGEAAAYEMTRKGVIEKGVTAEDFETHYDLGIAYKEMGLLDDAIAEFKMVMKDPTREVQCHLMIGLCCLEKGQQTEAIGNFKKGLYVDGITDRESLSLYFELGQAYERLGDPREALYYYEKVVKRDPEFRGVDKLVEALRGGATPAPVAPPAGGDDVDAAFDTLLGNGES